VPPDKRPPRTHRSLSKARMEALSDGVFGFAITLLVLDIALRPPPGSPLHRVLQAWPAYFAYLISFLTIGAAWLAHTALTDRLERVDPIFQRLNLLVLLVVVFLPFPTRLVSESLRNFHGEVVYVTMYGLTILAIRIAGGVLDAYAGHEHLYSPEKDDEELHRHRRKTLPALVAYVIAILVGLVEPLVSMAFYFALAVFLVVPFRDVGRLLFRRS
jgi:uncharacterized membrane protein